MAAVAMNERTFFQAVWCRFSSVPQ